MSQQESKVDLELKQNLNRYLTMGGGGATSDLETRQLIAAVATTLSCKPNQTSALLLTQGDSFGTLNTLGRTSPSLFDQDRLASMKVNLTDITISEDSYQQLGRAHESADARIYTVEFIGKGISQVVLMKSRGRSLLTSMSYERLPRSVLEADMQNLMDVDHPNVLALVAYCPRPNAMITEHVAGTLHAMVTSETKKYQREAWQVGLIADLTNALIAVHNAQIVHCQVYPETVMIKYDNYRGEGKPSAVLAGFGYAVKTGRPVARFLQEQHPSAVYAAPELVRQTAKTAQPSLDVWAFGMVCHYVLTAGQVQLDIQLVKYEDVTAEHPLQSFYGESPANESAGKLREVMKRCCRLSPGERPRLADLKEEIMEIRNAAFNLDDF